MKKEESDDFMEKKLKMKNKGFTDDNKKWLKAKLIESSSEEEGEDEDEDEDDEGDGEIEMEEDDGSDEGSDDGEESDEDSEDEMDVEKKSRFLDAQKQREVEEARQEEMQLNIQGDADDFRLPTEEVVGSFYNICVRKYFSEPSNIELFFIRFC